MKILAKFFSKNILSIQKKVITLHSQLSADGAIAQLVEQRTENPCVPGSIPGGTTSGGRCIDFYFGKVYASFFA